MTVHEYDEQGRVSRSVETTEAEWDAESYGLMAALADYEDLPRCPNCQQPLDECMDPGADPNRPGGEFVYVPTPVGRCWSCDATARAQEPFLAEDANVVRPQALHFTAVRTPRRKRT